MEPQDAVRHREGCRTLGFETVDLKLKQDQRNDGTTSGGLRLGEMAAGSFGYRGRAMV